MKTREVTRRQVLAIVAAAFVILGLPACGTPEARSPNPMRPIDEGRAVKVIAEAITAEGHQPLAPRMVSLSGDVNVRMDVGVAGRKLGFVYLTAADVANLGDNPVAKRSTGGNELIVRAGEGDDEGMRVVILYASDYVYDDNVGSDREATAITAENKLDRDVRDFLAIARKNHWP